MSVEVPGKCFSVITLTSIFIYINIYKKKKDEEEEAVFTPFFMFKQQQRFLILDLDQAVSRRIEAGGGF